MAAHFRRLSMALVIASPLAAPVRAQAVEYPAGTTKYLVTTSAKGSQSSPAGSQSFEIALREQVSVELMKHAKDTVMATMTIDSIAISSSAGPAPDVSAAKGAKFVNFMSPTGKVYSSRPPAGMDPMAAQVTEGIGRFLPAYRSNLSKGMTWSDTTIGKVSQQGMEMDRTVVANYTVAGDTTIAGRRALRVNRITTTKASGSGNAQGTPLVMETIGNGSGMFFLTPKGAYLGTTSTDEVTSKITVLAQNVEIAVKQTVQTTVEAIK